MPTILRDLPFYDRPTEAAFDKRSIAIRADQIMIWIGITEEEQTAFDPRRSVFPAILDTGLSHSFSIRAEHLIRWAGLDPRRLEQVADAKIGGENIPLYRADVWIHANVRGKRNRAAGVEPFRLVLRSIAVYPPSMSGAPRLPLLGLRALRLAGLHLTIDGLRCSVTLRTARRFWFF